MHRASAEGHPKVSDGGPRYAHRIRETGVDAPQKARRHPDFEAADPESGAETN